MTRVLAIGIDAAEQTLVHELVAAGRMPTLARLGRTGASCDLENIVEYRSELPWTQFVTGRDALASRYWSTVEFDAGSYDVFEKGAHRGRPFYAGTDEAFVISFDVPHSVIARDVNGVQITAWGAHSPQYPRASDPPGLLRQIDEKFGPHPAFENDYHGGWYQPRFLDTLRDKLLEGAQRRVDIVEWLMGEFPQWTMFLTVMSETHSAGHHMWHGVAADHPLHHAPTASQARRLLEEVYEGVDAAIGRLVERVEEDVVVVVFSVHGMQPNDNDVTSLVLLPEFLHRLEFGDRLMAEWSSRRGRRTGSPPPVMLDPSRMWASYMHERFAEGRADRLRRTIRLATPPAVLDAKRRVQWKLRGKTPITGHEFEAEVPDETTMTPEEIETSYRAEITWQIPTWYRHHWPRMQAFALPTFSDGKVRINLQGRERDGVVPRDEYAAALDRVERELAKCRNPRTGRTVVRDIIRMRTDDVDDPGGPDADLVVLWSEPIDAFDHPDVGRVGPFPFLRTGEHSSNGFAFIAGPGIEPVELTPRPAFDISPTVLSLANLPVDPSLAGTPIEFPDRTPRPA